MKKTLKQLIFFSLLAAIFVSCKKDDPKVSYESGKDPVLTATNYSDTMVLLKDNKDLPAITLSWTNPDYQFSTGISSQDVSYTIQVDTTLSFDSPLLSEQVIAKDLGATLTQGQLNFLLALTTEDIPHDVKLRIKASLVNNAVPLYSNAISLRVTPYLDVAVPLPLTGRLFLIGDATAGGWTNPVNETTQEFTRTSSTKFEITIHLEGGKAFLAIPDNGSWANKYAARGTNIPDGDVGGEFGYNGGDPNYNDNFHGPSASGLYKIVFDFKLGKYTITLQ